MACAARELRARPLCAPAARTPWRRPRHATWTATWRPACGAACRCSCTVTRASWQSAWWRQTRARWGPGGRAVGAGPAGARHGGVRAAPASVVPRQRQHAAPVAPPACAACSRIASGDARRRAAPCHPTRPPPSPMTRQPHKYLLAVCYWHCNQPYRTAHLLAGARMGAAHARSARTQRTRTTRAYGAAHLPPRPHPTPFPPPARLRLCAQQVPGGAVVAGSGQPPGG